MGIIMPPIIGMGMPIPMPMFIGIMPFNIGIIGNIGIWFMPPIIGIPPDIGIIEPLIIGIEPLIMGIAFMAFIASSSVPFIAFVAFMSLIAFIAFIMASIEFIASSSPFDPAYGPEGRPSISDGKLVLAARPSPPSALARASFPLS
jgi:hypothetical protein